MRLPFLACLIALLVAVGCAGEGRSESPEKRYQTDCAEVNGAFDGFGSSAAPDTTTQPAASGPAQTSSFSPETHASGERERASEVPQDIFEGKVSQGETQAHSLYIDAADTLTVQMYSAAEATAQVGLEMEAPNGEVIDPGSAQGTPSVAYYDPDGGKPQVKGYLVSQPQTGTWTLRVIGDDVPSSGSVSYAIRAGLKGAGSKGGSAVALSASTKEEFYQSGDQVTLEAKLQGRGSALTGSSSVSLQARVVRPDSSTAELTLLDDGTSGDESAGDGVYTATLDETSPAGWYDFFVTAEGTSGASFSRKAFTQVPVSSSNSGLTGSFEESTSDTDEDGLIGELTIEVGVRIGEAGKYLLGGRLTGTDGSFISSDGLDTTLSAGTYVLDLSFDGRHIYKSGLGGPYRLQRLSLAETGSEILPASFLEDAYRTEAYTRESFEHRTGLRGRRAPRHAPEDLTAREYMEEVRKTVAKLDARAVLSLAPEGVSSPEKARSHVAACLLKRHEAADSIRVSSGGASVRFYDKEKGGWLNIVWGR